MSQPLKILIAGAGIGGLSAAACLLQAGFDVEVFERATVLGEIGAGVQQSANATHVMRDIGILEALEAVAYRPAVTEFRTFDSGTVLQALSLAQRHESRFGAPYLQLHRADFHKILVARVEALKPGAIRLGCAVEAFVEEPGHVEVELEGGLHISGALLIGADGIKSNVRKQIAGPSAPVYTGDAAWRLTVPVARLREDFLDGKSSIWVGPDKHAVVYFLRGGSLLNFVAAVEYDEWIEESWTHKQPWSELKRDLCGWHDDIQTIVDNADRDQCYRWALNVHPFLDTWSTRRATLLGDAAHPTLPYLAQGAAMAVEDAAVLTRALVSLDDVGEALRVYQAHRQPRTARVVRESQENRKLFHMPDMHALREAFAKRDMDGERAGWLYAYNPLTADLQTPALH